MGSPPHFNPWALAVDLLNIYDIIFARYVPAYIATRKWRVQLKVTPRVATPGAESAVHRLPVDKVVGLMLAPLVTNHTDDVAQITRLGLIELIGCSYLCDWNFYACSHSDVVTSGVINDTAAVRFSIAKINEDGMLYSALNSRSPQHWKWLPFFCCVIVCGKIYQETRVKSNQSFYFCKFRVSSSWLVWPSGVPIFLAGSARKHLPKLQNHGAAVGPKCCLSTICFQMHPPPVTIKACSQQINCAALH